MLIAPSGQELKTGAPEGTSAAAAQKFVFDAGEQDFEDRVLRASMDKPVLVDFWAPWCGPCRQLTPALEKRVEAAQGKVLMARVNVDENPQIAQALQIQSLPTVYAFYRGQPLDGFTGVQPDSVIARFIENLLGHAGKTGDGNAPVETLLEEGQLALDSKEFDTAVTLFTEITGVDPDNEWAWRGLLHAMIGLGRLEGAQERLDQLSDEMRQRPGLRQSQAALDLARATRDARREDSRDLQDLSAQIAGNPEDQEIRYAYALACLEKGMTDMAIDTLIESLRQDRFWSDEKARKKLLEIFESLGSGHPASMAGRRKMASILFA